MSIRYSHWTVDAGQDCLGGVIIRKYFVMCDMVNGFCTYTLEGLDTTSDRPITVMNWKNPLEKL